MAQPPSYIPLDVTHVIYDETSLSALCLALLTLSPVLLNPAYAALIVYTRELLFVEMYIGQLLSEVANWFLKHAVQQDRPDASLGSGYGFPSSHSQWMGYFSTFLLLHFTIRHRFAPTGSWSLDFLRRATLYSLLLAWAGAVAFSRFYLSYHTPMQVLWGLGLGSMFAAAWYSLVEYLPRLYTDSALGKLRTLSLTNTVSSWFRLRDGWTVWADGGTEAQWHAWRSEWDRRRGQSKKV